MTTQLIAQPIWRLYDNSGNLAVGGQVYTYQAGTTTPQATYQDQSGVSPNTNPIITNSRGEWQMWLTPGLAYKFIAKDVAGNNLWSVDNVTINDLTATSGSSGVGFIQAGSGARARTVQDKAREQFSVLDYVDPNAVSHVAGINAALTQAKLLGISELQVPAGNYIIDGAIVVPAGMSLVGFITGVESSYKAASTSSAPIGSVFKMRGMTAQIQLGDNSAIEGFTLWHDDQNWNIVTDAGQPDGYTAWNDYPAAISFVGNYSSVRIERIVVLGCTRFFYSGASNNLEKVLIRHIRGYPLLVGVEIFLATDMTYIEDVHWNPNSMFQLPGYTATNAKSDKFVRNMVPFKLGRVDGGFLQNVFTYCCRDFVWLKYDPAHTGGVGGSIRVTNFGADICHNVLRVEQTQRGFGIAFVNGYAINNVNIIYDEEANAVVTRDPGFVRLGNDAPVGVLENVHVELVACKRSPGRAVAGIPGTGTPQNLFFFDDSGATDVSIDCTSCDFDEVNSGVIVDQTALNNAVRRFVTLTACDVRANQTDPPSHYNATFSSLATGSYAYLNEDKTGYVGGSALIGQFRRRAQDAAETDWMGFELHYKDGGGNQKVGSFFRTVSGSTQRLLEVDRATGNTQIGTAAWNGPHLALGTYHLWIDALGRLRIKSSTPTSDTDGTVVGTQS